MDVRGYINENAAGFFDALMQWLAIPSISADPGHSGDVRRSAEWLAGHLRQSGFPVAEIWETGPDGGGLPAVFAHWPAADPSAPVVLIYGHHDVQPVEPLDEWDSPPFQPVLDSDRIHAPNERAEMALLLKGAEAAAYLWDELAAAADDVTVPR